MSLERQAESLSSFLGRSFRAQEPRGRLCRVETGLDRGILRKMMKSEEIYTTFLPVVQIV